MSAKWMRVETDFVDHPKVRALASILDVTRGDAGWVILRAWSWMSRFCPTGQVVGQPTGQVVGQPTGQVVGHLKMSLAEAAGQHLSKPIGTEELLSALVSVGLFEESADGSINGHDWAEHQGKVATTAEKERERKRAYRAKASGDVPGTSRGTSDGTKTGRPAQRNVTGRDVTGRIKEEPEPHPDHPLRAAWNETAGTVGCPKWVETPKHRRKAADAALARRPLEQWRQVFAAIAADPFATGKDPASGGWRADVDYALRPGGVKPEPALKYLERAANPTPQAVIPKEHRKSRDLS